MLMLGKALRKRLVFAVVIVLAGFTNANAQSTEVAAKLLPVITLLLDGTQQGGGQPPVVGFIVPNANQQFVFGSDVIVEASATDTDGSIDRVELFIDGVFVRTERNPPFTWNDTSRGAADPQLSQLSVGQHQLRLDAYDDAGLLTRITRSISITEAPVNQPPSVSFVSPNQNQTFNQGQSVTVAAMASDSDGSVARVELRVNGGAAQPDTSAPYSWQLNNLAVGPHNLSLTAVDNLGAESLVATRSITVVEVPVNQPPVLSFNTPSNLQTFTEGETVSVGIAASDNDGSVSRVDLYIDGIFDSSDNSAPYSWSVDNLTVGQHALRAVATDDDGAESEVTIAIIVEEEVINPPDDNLRAGRPVLNVLRYRVAGTSGNAALDSGNFSNWNIVAETNASVDVAANNRSVTFSRNVANDGSNARAYIEFTLGPVWDDADLSVCMEVSGYNERNSGTRNVSLQVVGSHLSGTLTRTPTSNGIWCSVLQLTANATTTVVRLGLGVTGNDTRTNALTVSNFSFSPTKDGLPNEYVAVQPQFSLPGNTTGWNGGVFNYNKSVSYNANTGDTVFTAPASVDNTPAASHIMSIFDSYGGFVSRATTRWLIYGLQQTPEYIMTNNARSGRALGDTYQTSLLDDMYAAAPTPKPGILLIRQAGNDLKVNAETAAQTDTYLQWHIDWAQANNMQVILTTATPFRGSSNWTQARQNQLEAYNDLVRARSGQAGITVIDEYALIDTNNDGQIDGDDDVPDDIDNGEGFAANDLVHATASGYRVLAEAHDAAIKAIINSTQPISSGSVNAVINPSRTECASPCTVVFSADKTTAQGLDDHGIWSRLSYYWDFDTDESDTFGALYDQTYNYVTGDTSHEKGHVPMATKTFLCETGTCVYNVGMRAQNTAGEFDDAFVEITVQSESVQWQAANTVCISNDQALSITDDWTLFDKPCPQGAGKQKVMLDADNYDGKLVLLKRGDVFEQNIASLMSESNFKLGYFGDTGDARPEIDGSIEIGVASYSGADNAPTGISTFVDDTEVATMGWPENVYVEGLKIASFGFPMSYTHVGIHDLDMDRESYATGGRIALTRRSTLCIDSANLDCANVPFAKGGYISQVDVVGSDAAETNAQTLNVAGLPCDMTNFLGIVNSRFRKAGEHNLRVMGWWRLNIMRSSFRGQHYSPGKSNVNPRGCLSGVYTLGVWESASDLPANYAAEVEGRSRQDLESTSDDKYIHLSRYQVINGNRIGDSSMVGTHPGGQRYATSQLSGDRELSQDIVVTDNVFERDASATIPNDISLASYYSICVANTYFDGLIRCYPSTLEDQFPGSFREPTPITPPLKPGSL